VLEHGEDEIATSPGEADDGGVVVFPFDSFALVVRTGGRVVLSGDERGEEHGVLEAVIPGACPGGAVEGAA
jgi:hypothetical protein